jgi:hypothetical protein
VLTVILAVAIVLATLALRTLLERGSYTPAGTFAARTVETDSYRNTAVPRP